MVFYHKALGLDRKSNPRVTYDKELRGWWREPQPTMLWLPNRGICLPDRFPPNSCLYWYVSDCIRQIIWGSL